MSDKFKVLMIDDERDIVQFFAQTFNNFKHIEFFTALRAAQGIEIAKTEKPQVILLDLRMPEMNGEEALEELRALLPETKFIIMTGWENGETQKRLEATPQVAAFYSKPIDLEKVVTKVMNLIMIKDKTHE